MKKKVIIWHPWDPLGRVNSGKNLFWVQTATVHLPSTYLLNALPRHLPGRCTMNVLFKGTPWKRLKIVCTDKSSWQLDKWQNCIPGSRLLKLKNLIPKWLVSSWMNWQWAFLCNINPCNFKNKLELIHSTIIESSFGLIDKWIIGDCHL